jgi:hypothetical protein
MNLTASSLLAFVLGVAEQSLEARGGVGDRGADGAVWLILDDATGQVQALCR